MKRPNDFMVHLRVYLLGKRELDGGLWRLNGRVRLIVWDEVPLLPSSDNGVVGC